MIAVLPFGNLSGDLSQGYFSDGLTEEMISQLGRVNPQDLGVIARTSSMHYKDSDKGIAEIGADLQVEYLLEGSMRRSADRLRITAQLVHVEDQCNLWSQSFDREVSDILSLQTEVAAKIAASVLAQLGSSVPVKIVSHPGTTSAEAYEAYLKGRHYWNQRSDESLLKSIHYFNQAIDKDPELAVAYCGLGETYNLLAVYGILPPREAMPLAKTAALRALEINGGLGEAHACLGEIRSFYEWNWEAANQEYERALNLNPSYAAAHHYYGYYLAVMGQHERAQNEISLADSYDPHSLVIPVWKALSLRLAGRYKQAIEICQKTLHQDPHFALAHWVLGLATQELGDLPRALAAFEDATKLAGTNPAMLSALGYAQAVSGQRKQASATLHRLEMLSAKRYVAAYDIAMVHLGLGNEEEALTFFDRAIEERSTWVVTLPVEPRVVALKGNSQFGELVRKLIPLTS
jgi:TolB-like protein/Flp pilus assembly protein TadD